MIDIEQVRHLSDGHKREILNSISLLAGHLVAEDPNRLSVVVNGFSQGMKMKSSEHIEALSSLSLVIGIMSQSRLSQNSKDTVVMHLEKAKSESRVPLERYDDFITKFKLKKE